MGLSDHMYIYYIHEDEDEEEDESLSANPFISRLTTALNSVILRVNQTVTVIIIPQNMSC